MTFEYHDKKEACDKYGIVMTLSQDAVCEWQDEVESLSRYPYQYHKFNQREILLLFDGADEQLF